MSKEKNNVLGEIFKTLKAQEIIVCFPELLRGIYHRARPKKDGLKFYVNRKRIEICF